MKRLQMLTKGRRRFSPEALKKNTQATDSPAKMRISKAFSNEESDFLFI